MKKDTLSAIAFAAILAAFLVIGGPAVAAGVDITGHWWGSNGVEYDITQVGTAFNWKVPTTGEIGVGTINGKDCSAGWPFGFATGMIVTNPSGAAIEINWSNGVVFRRPATGGGTGTGTGPGTGTAPGGGTSSDLKFTFGPNPAWPGAKVWVKLSLPVAHDIRVWHNGQLLSITNFISDNEIEVTLPWKVTTGSFRVEYHQRHIDANQPNKNIEIKPLDISGQWKWPIFGMEISVKQTGSSFLMTFSGGGQPTETFNGEIIDGNKVRYYTKKDKSDYKNISVITVDPQGRVTEMRRDDGSGPMIRK